MVVFLRFIINVHRKMRNSGKMKNIIRSELGREELVVSPYQNEL